MTRRNFSLATRKAAYARDGGKCCRCGVAITFAKSNCDHVLPCALGGGNDLANAATLCIPCHRDFKTRDDVRRIRKADRQKKYHETGRSRARRGPPMQGRGFTGWRRFDGSAVKAETRSGANAAGE